MSPSFVLQYDPSNAPLIQVAVLGEGFSGPQLYDDAPNSLEPLLEGIPGVASASPDGGRMRQINVVVDPVKAQARGVTSADVSVAVSQSNALLPSGKFIPEGFDANVYTHAVPDKIRLIGTAWGKLKHGQPVLLRDVARVEDGGAPETQSVSMDCRNAVVQAAFVRFIPIAMTSLPTLTGLLPTALRLKKAAAANRPLALAVVGGLASSTLLSLFLVPALFTLLAGRREGSR